MHYVEVFFLLNCVIFAIPVVIIGSCFCIYSIYCGVKFFVLMGTTLSSILLDKLYERLPLSWLRYRLIEKGSEEGTQYAIQRRLKGLWGIWNVLRVLDKWEDSTDELWFDDPERAFEYYHREIKSKYELRTKSYIREIKRLK